MKKKGKSCSPSVLKVILLCAISATTSSPALAANSMYENYGLRYYQAKDYTSAAGYFRKAVDQNPQEAKSRYLYGLALMQLGKRNDALSQFYKSFHMDPAASYAGQIKALLQKYNYKPNASDISPSSSGSANSSNISVSSAAPEDETPVKPEELEAIKRRLPKINSYSQSGPSLNDFNQWTSMQMGSYLFGGARTALAEADNNARMAQAQLDEAKKQLEVALPVFPNYGETPDDFKKRRAHVQKASQVLLEPYQELATETRNKFQDATTIKNRAEQELNRGTVVGPYWLPR